MNAQFSFLSNYFTILLIIPCLTMPHPSPTYQEVWNLFFLDHQSKQNQTSPHPAHHWNTENNQNILPNHVWCSCIAHVDHECISTSWDERGGMIPPKVEVSTWCSRNCSTDFSKCYRTDNTPVPETLESTASRPTERVIHVPITDADRAGMTFERLGTESNLQP